MGAAKDARRCLPQLGRQWRVKSADADTTYRRFSSAEIFIGPPNAPCTRLIAYCRTPPAR